MSKIRIITIPLSILLVGCAAHPGNTNLRSKKFKHMFEIVEDGKWRWEDQTCEEYTASYSIDLKRKKMILTTETSVAGQSAKKIAQYEYAILYASENGFRCKVINEKRLSKEGIPVEWDFVLVNDSTYYWVRSDWEKGSGTKDNIKCTN